MPAEVWAKRARERTYEVSERAWARALRAIAAGASPQECIYIAQEGADMVGLVHGWPGENGWPPTDGQGLRAVCAGKSPAEWTGPTLGSGGRRTPGTARPVRAPDRLPGRECARRFYETFGGHMVGERLFDEAGVMLPEVVYGWTDTATLLVMSNAGAA
jgi:hypothetical protein